jgi:predicted DNA binding CopG/RHH family protein
MVLVIGERGRRRMKKKIVYTDEPMNLGRVVEDFLPRPKDLVLRKERVVTLRLDDSTITELKAEANRKGLGVSSLVRMWVRERLESAHARS